ncbi:MAG TPA: hypothetical protein VFU78_22915 [Thermomicrobiales bacterium]|nr:hypothetical protein [Thermomicrobiales bacterium]
MPRKRAFKPEPPIHRFHVRLLGGPPAGEIGDVWRDIELAANQTLLDLGWAIPPAFDFDDDHLWAFYLSGQPFDSKTEYALSAEPNPFTGEAPKRAEDHTLRGVHFPRHEFLYIFDFGDEWHFGVQLADKSNDLTPGAAYPRVAASHGKPPPQYPDWDEEEWDDEDEE